jgi:lipid-A-disaccharide synthase
MHLFVSAGEPSGDLHGANLIRHLRERLPHSTFAGFGGDRMAAAGAELLYPLTNLAVMWFGEVFKNLRTFFRLADEAEAYFRDRKPDAVVLIDYPGFHWHIAKRAKKHGIPVYYFVPPQLWAWAGWRVKKMRASVETVLTALPFEDDWYKARGVNTHYVGHPYFDEIRKQQLDATFMAGLGDRPIVGLLPGSRTKEVAKNFPMMLAAAKQVQAERPDVEFHVAAFNEKQADVARTMASEAGIEVTVHVGRTPEIIERSRFCIACSGSVSLELLTRKTPAIIVYKMGRVGMFVAKRFLVTVKYITLPNLLADEELFPEFPTATDKSKEIAATALLWLNDPMVLAERTAKLAALRDRCAVPGACERAAAFLADRLAGASPAIRKAA